MSDKDLNIKIVTTKEGAGAQQAKQEIDGLKTSVEGADTSTSSLRFKLIGFRQILSSVGMIAHGGAEAFAGLGRAIGGLVMVLSNTVFGRLAMIAGVLVGIGAAIYEKFNPAKEALDKTAEAAANLDKKLPKDLGEPGIPNAIEEAKQLTDQFNKATAAAERTRKSMDEMGDAQLALKLANIDKEVAGGLNEDQGKQARIEARLASEQEKLAREKATVKDTIDRGEKTIDTTEESTSDIRKGIQDTEAEMAAKRLAAIQKGILKTHDEDYAAQYAANQASAGTKTPLETRPGRVGIWKTSPGEKTDAETYAERDAAIRDAQRTIIDLNALKMRLDAQKKALLDRVTAEYATKEKIGPEVETGKARLGTLDVLSQAATVTASGQSIAVARDINARKDAAEEKANTEKQAAAEQVRKAQEENAKIVNASRKSKAEERAQLILEEEKAKEQSAHFQLQSDLKAAGARGQTPGQRAASAAALQSSQTRWSQEHGDVSQASALQGKLRQAVDPADVAKLLNALESISYAFHTVAGAADKTASQMKNGGMRTK